MSNESIIKEREGHGVEFLIDEIRDKLLLALKHTRGEEVWSFIRIELYIRESLDELQELEELVT